MNRAQEWAAWTLGVLLSLGASFATWFYGAMSFCAQETYETSSPLCGALVHPIVPWVLLSSTPTAIAIVGGALGIRLHNRRLFQFSLWAPIVLALASIVVFPAIY